MRYQEWVVDTITSERRTYYDRILDERLFHQRFIAVVVIKEWKLALYNYVAELWSKMEKGKTSPSILLSKHTANDWTFVFSFLLAHWRNIIKCFWCFALRDSCRKRFKVLICQILPETQNFGKKRCVLCGSKCLWQFLK